MSSSAGPAKALVGISALTGKTDLSDLNSILDEIEALAVDTIELPTYDMDLVIGGRIYRQHLQRLKAACASRSVGWTVHGPLGINFMDEPHRLARHYEVLMASVEIAAEIGARNYVMHTGIVDNNGAAQIDAAYARQRDMLEKAGEMARGHGVLLCVENVFADTKGAEHTASAGQLARELAAVNHAQGGATVDFSHALLECGFRGGDFLEEVAPLTALAPHLHIHDSFGRPDDIWMYAIGEKLAFGHGDLHLPVGWGGVPWEDIMATCRFRPGVVFNIELDGRYWYHARETVAATRAIAAKAQFVAAA